MSTPTHDNGADVITPVVDALAQAIYAFRNYGDYRDTPNPDYYRHQAQAHIRHLLDAGWMIERIPYQAWLAAQGVNPDTGEPIVTTHDNGAHVKQWPLWVLLPAVVGGTSWVGFLMTTMMLPIPSSDHVWRLMLIWMLSNIAATGFVVALGVSRVAEKAR